MTLAYSALVHLESGKLFLAYKKAIKAVGKDAGNPITHAILGLSYKELGMTKLANKALEKSLAINADFQQTKTLLQYSLSQTPNNQYSHWIKAHLYLQTNDVTGAAKSFERAANIQGRYQMSAKVYLALIHKNKVQLESLNQQLSNEVKQGNQWAELHFDKALIQLANDNMADAIEHFQQAIDAGISQKYRFKNDPLLLTISDNVEFQRITKALELNINKQRQQAIAMEYLSQAL